MIFHAMPRKWLSVLLALAFPAALAAGNASPAAGIASSHPLATDAGHVVLEAGGNAFDAAIAVAAALSVVDPANSGLGGGGFWLLHRAADGHEIVIDARERAPAAASADMYLNRDGRVIPRLSLDGPLAAAIPGTPASFEHISRRYGRLPLATTLAPAICLARNGFVLTDRYRKLIERRLPVLAEWPSAKAVFLPDGLAPEPGYRLRQPELATTLEHIAAEGAKGFYHGETAARLVEGVRSAGGVWTRADLEGYRVLERPPLRGTYRGMRVTSVPLPSSGGIVLLQMLKILEPYRLEKLPGIGRERLLIEAMRMAYRDRAEHLGDADFVEVDVERLLSAEHIRSLRDQIGKRVLTQEAGKPVRNDGENTAHFSVIDREGNRVAATLTLNTHFGSGFMPPGTGVLLNNEMDDFAIKPGSSDTYGLVGNIANAIAPRKRPLSSMTPSFLETTENVVVIGTPGGGRIISMMLHASLEIAAGRGDVRNWVKLPRFHHQYQPDFVEYEPGVFNTRAIRRLIADGYNLKPVERGYGNMQVVVWNKKTNLIDAASDPRGEGAAVVK